MEVGIEYFLFDIIRYYFLLFLINNINFEIGWINEDILLFLEMWIFVFCILLFIFGKVFIILFIGYWMCGVCLLIINIMLLMEIFFVFFCYFLCFWRDWRYCVFYLF